MSDYGKYEILELIGMGGFGQVYRARDTQLERTVAIKTCRSDVAAVRERFVREGRIAGNLQHPHIVVVHELGFQPDGVPYLAQEFVEGRDLRELVKSGTPVDTKQKIAILAATADALQYAHGQGIIHRDVKPANIRVGAQGEIKLLDFGMARLLETATQLTRTGETVGTIAYVAPEMLQGNVATPQSDLFSWGVTAYELITGYKPFRGNSVSRVMFEILSASPRPPREIEPRCPKRLSDLVMRSLEKDPASRHASFEKVVTELRRARREHRRAMQRELASGARVDPEAPTAATLALPGSRGSTTTSEELQLSQEDAAMALFDAFHNGLRDPD